MSRAGVSTSPWREAVQPGRQGEVDHAGGVWLRHALDEGAILDEDAARVCSAAGNLRVLGIRRERLAVALVGGEAREVDQCEGRIRGPGELRRRVVAGELAATAFDGEWRAARVGLEVGELGGVDRVPNGECDHGVL